MVAILHATDSLPFVGRSFYNRDHDRILSMQAHQGTVSFSTKSEEVRDMPITKVHCIPSKCSKEGFSIVTVGDCTRQERGNIPLTKVFQASDPKKGTVV